MEGIRNTLGIIEIVIDFVPWDIELDQLGFLCILFNISLHTQDRLSPFRSVD